MDKLNFIGSLDQEQAENAVKVARIAREAGVDPTLAVAIAFKESSLRTNAPRGSSGEIGMMQVMPSTGKGLGYDEEKLANPNQNIKAGIQYLKQGLQATENDPKLAAIYYNGGPGAVEALKAGREPDPRVFDYVRLLNSYGAFSEQQPAGQRPSEQNDDMVVADAPPPPPPPLPKSDTSGAKEGERFLGGLLGTGVGLASTGAKAVSSTLTNMAANRAAADEAARISARRAAGMAPPAAPSASGIPATPAHGGLPATRQAGPAGGPLSNAQQTARILQGTLGDEGTTGRARATGFNAQTAQEAATQKEMQRLTQRLQQSGVLAEDASALFARQPGMTATPSGVLYPRTESPATLGPRGPQGQIGFTVPPAPATPAPPSFASRVASGIAERATSGLDQVNRIFNNMMRPVGSYLGKYLAPPLAGLGAGLDAAELAHEYKKPEDQRDYTKMGLQGAGVVGGALSMFPPTARVGIPLSLGVLGAQQYLYNPEVKEYIRKKFEREPTLPQSSSRELYAP